MRKIVVNNPAFAFEIEQRTGIVPALFVTRSGALLYVFTIHNNNNNFKKK